MTALPRPHRRTLRGWLSFTLGSVALLLGPVNAAGTASSAPAQRLFNEVNRLVQQNYGGLSSVDRVALAKEYQQRLDAVCATEPQTCPVDKAYPVIQAEITALGDEHTYFQTPDMFEDFMAGATGGERKQFGVKLGELDGENRVVLEVVPESPAEVAGLRRGDILKTLDGQPYKYEGLHQARLNGKTVQVGLERQGQSLTLSITPRASSTLDLPRLTTTGTNKDIGVLRIPTFLTGGGVAQKVHDLIGEAQQQKLKGLIVDLRGDTGGRLDECDSSISAFVPDFTRIARTPDGDVRTRVSRGLRLEDGRAQGGVRNPKLWTGPVAVMVDQGSASCSEFFAFELQYIGRGPIIGEDTAGVSNTVTRLFEVGDKAALQLTIANYVKPNGSPYPVRVTPDQRREFTEDDMRRLTQGEDVVLNMAVTSLNTAPSLGTEYARP